MKDNFSGEWWGQRHNSSGYGWENKTGGKEITDSYKVLQQKKFRNETSGKVREFEEYFLLFQFGGY